MTTNSGACADQVGIVTGAAGGIGRASAVALGRQGAFVVVADLPEKADEAAETVELVLASGGKAQFAPLDVTVESDWQRVLDVALAVTGRLDFAHNNAGVSLALPFLETSLENYLQVLEVNLTGVWLGMQQQIPVMVAQGGGAIVNTASLAGLRGLARGSIYSTSKHAVVGLTRSLALEFAGSGLRINCVCPAAVSTAMTAALPDDLREQIVAPQAIKRFAQPTEIGEAVAWLLSDAASFITGAVVPVDGGATAG